MKRGRSSFFRSGRNFGIPKIKAERISDPAKMRTVQAELAALAQVRDRSIFNREGIEDEVRTCEHARGFGPRFISSSWRGGSTRIMSDDEAIRRRINKRLGSQSVVADPNPRKRITGPLGRYSTSSLGGQDVCVSCFNLGG